MQDEAANNRAAPVRPAPLSRFSTSTVFGSKYLVPWLAAQGPLAYNPVEPPARDYFFQYSWIVPGIFDPKVNLREHRYFGRYRKDSSKFLFDFWSNVRKGSGATLQQYCEPGLFSDIEVRTPLAAYHHVRKYYNTAGSLLIQHGSYQWISREDQPGIEQGEVLLYRGIGQSSVFRSLQFEPSDLTAANRDIWRKYLGVQAEMLSDSVLSFNTIHDRVKRSETEGLRHGTWVGDTMATQAGLDIESPGNAQRPLARRPAGIFPGSYDRSLEIRSSSRRDENPAQQHPAHYILRGRVRGEDHRPKPTLFRSEPCAAK